MTQRFIWNCHCSTRMTVSACVFLLGVISTCGFSGVGTYGAVIYYVLCLSDCDAATTPATGVSGSANHGRHRVDRRRRRGCSIDDCAGWANRDVCADWGNGVRVGPASHAHHRRAGTAANRVAAVLDAALKRVLRLFPGHQFDRHPCVSSHSGHLPECCTQCKQSLC